MEKYNVFYLDNGKKKIEMKALPYESAVKWRDKMNHAYGGILQIEEAKAPKTSYIIK